MKKIQSMIVDAAAGDIESLKLMLLRCRKDEAMRGAALLACDPNPDPLTAALCLAAMHPSSLPPALDRIAQRIAGDAILQLASPARRDVLDWLERTLLSDQVIAVLLRDHVVADADLREALTVIATQARRTIGTITRTLHADQWRLFSPDQRLRIAEGAPWSVRLEMAQRFWFAMTDVERDRIAWSGIRSADSVAALVQRIGSDGWALLDVHVQRQLANALANSPRDAAVAAGIVWEQLEPALRDRLMTVIAAHPAAEAAFADARRAHSAARDDSQERTNASSAARRSARTAGDEMDAAAWDDAFARALKQPLDAAELLISQHSALPPDAVRRLAWAAVGEDADLAVARSFMRVRRWHAWMELFLPDAHAAPHVIALWRRAATMPELPETIAWRIAALPHLVQRRTRMR